MNASNFVITKFVSENSDRHSMKNKNCRFIEQTNGSKDGITLFNIALLKFHN